MPIVTNRNPADSATGVYAPTGFLFDLTDAVNGIQNSSILIKINGLTIYSTEVFSNDWALSTRTNITNGFRFLLKPKADYRGVANTSEAFIEISVDANNGLGAPMATDTWSFRLIDKRAPYIQDSIPEAFTWVAISPIALDFTLKDGSNTPGSVLLNSIHIDGVFAYDGTIFLAPYGAPGSVVTSNGDGLDIHIVAPPGNFLAGQHYLDIQTQDNEVLITNRTTIRYWFGVGDAERPKFRNLSPLSGSIGNPVGTNIEFEITDNVGINGPPLPIPLEMQLDGVLVYDGAGIGFQAGFAGSVIPLVAPEIGLAVVINPDVNFGDNTWHRIHVDASDTTVPIANRAIFTAHFHTGATTLRELSYDSTGLDEDTHFRILDNAVVDILPFDFSGGAFFNPTEKNLTGFGYDGAKYTNGQRTTDEVASWHTEVESVIRGVQRNFPASGSTVLTSKGWSIQELYASQRMWISCPRIPSITTDKPWSMALSSFKALKKIHVGKEPALVLFGESILLIDFTQDNAIRYNRFGRAVSTQTIDGRSLDQQGLGFDAGYKIPTPTDTYLSGWGEVILRKTDQSASSRSELIIAGRTNAIDIIARLSKADKELLEENNILLAASKNPPEEGGLGFMITQTVDFSLKDIVASSAGFPSIIYLPIFLLLDDNAGSDEIWMVSFWDLLRHPILSEIPRLFVFSKTSAPVISGGPYTDIHLNTFIENGETVFILTLASAGSALVETLEINIENPSLSILTTYSSALLGLGAAGTSIRTAATEAGPARSLYAASSVDATGALDLLIRRSGGVNSTLATALANTLLKIRPVGAGI